MIFGFFGSFVVVAVVAVRAAAAAALAAARATAPATAPVRRFFFRFAIFGIGLERFSVL